MTATEGRTGVVGVGYEGRDAEQFVRELLTSGVDVVVDVRLTPISRKRGFSKRALTEHLETAGIRLKIPINGHASLRWAMVCSTRTRRCAWALRCASRSSAMPDMFSRREDLYTGRVIKPVDDAGLPGLGEVSGTARTGGAAEQDPSVRVADDLGQGERSFTSGQYTAPARRLRLQVGPRRRAVDDGVLSSDVAVVDHSYVTYALVVTGRGRYPVSTKNRT